MILTPTQRLYRHCLVKSIPILFSSGTDRWQQFHERVGSSLTMTATMWHRGKAQSEWQHEVYLLPVDLQSQRGVAHGEKDFHSVPC